MFVDTLTKLLNGNALLKSHKIFDDFSDRLCSIWTVFILIIFSSIITVRSYFYNPFACYIEQSPSGTNFLQFIETYCWSHGTLSIKPNEEFPNENQDWNLMTNKIKYYQWIPFILALQAVGFYFPRIIWNNFLLPIFGVDIEIEFENQIFKSHFTDESISQLTATIKESLHNFHKYPKIRKPNKIFIIYFLKSKLIRKYFFVKILYLFNSILQICFIHKILGFPNSVTNFFQVLQNYIHNQDDANWNVYFPRVAYCHVNYVMSVGSRMRYTAQCALSVNMINEKIYLFLWVWTLLSGIVIIGSMFWWIIEFLNEFYKHTYIKCLIRKCKITTNSGMIDKFIYEYLRGDGLFILLMLINNHNKKLTQLIFNKLWKSFNKINQSIEYLAQCNGVFDGKPVENFDFV